MRKEKNNDAEKNIGANVTNAKNFSTKMIEMTTVTSIRKMLENRPEDALDLLVLTVYSE